MSTPNFEYLDIPAGRFALADMRSRLGARIIDTVIIGIPIGIVDAVIYRASVPYDDSAEVGSGFGIDELLLAIVLGLAFSFAYEVGLTATQGATFGKKALGIRVASADTAGAPGEGIGIGPACARWATLMLPSALCGLWGLLCSASPLRDGAARQGWHDRASKTYVLAMIAEP
ncbi:RDD family protein [Nocardia sp. KC 131]|uniref:RDD family protein n=1 Tax=Nocardia arseniciresistens TaxID=3392119 RepID=UPI00398F4EA0